MRNTWAGPLALLCAAASIAGLRPAAADKSAAQQGGPAAFPSYAREDVVRVCLSEYGMGNSSVLDCLAQDQKIRAALARRWDDLDERSRTHCLARLADLHANSYSHLDACVRAADRDAPAPE